MFAEDGSDVFMEKGPFVGVCPFGGCKFHTLSHMPIVVFTRWMKALGWQWRVLGAPINPLPAPNSGCSAGLKFFSLYAKRAPAPAGCRTTLWGARGATVLPPRGTVPCRLFGGSPRAAPVPSRVTGAAAGREARAPRQHPSTGLFSSSSKN